MSYEFRKIYNVGTNTGGGNQDTNISAINMTLGWKDGLLYIFINGEPVGIGIELPSGGASGGIVGYVDSNNKDIVLSGELEDGSYVLKYVNADGVTTGICTLTIGDTKYTNFADPKSSDWLNGQRLNSSGEVKPDTVTYTTNYIKVKQGDTVRVRGLNIYLYGTDDANATTHFYNANKDRIGKITPRENGSLFGNVNVTEPDKDFVYTIANGAEFTTGSASDVAYIRFVGRLCTGCTVDDVIITVNQEITD